MHEEGMEGFKSAIEMSNDKIKGVAKFVSRNSNEFKLNTGRYGTMR